MSDPTPHLSTILRRALLSGAVGALGSVGARGAGATVRTSLTFPEVPHGISPGIVVPDGYVAQVLIRWGDPVVQGAPAFDPANQTAEAQATQFGTCNDFLAFLSLPRGSGVSYSGLLWANHEYPQANMMFPGLSDRRSALEVTREQVGIEMMAVGGSIVELEQKDGVWRVYPGALNRRITAETPMRIAGPAAGDARMRTSYDPTGTRVLGTVGNCAGGTTPWGTILTGEENIDQFFFPASNPPPEAAHPKWFGPRGTPRQGWGRFHDRFAMDKEPNEVNRFGWIVEIDPYDPTSTPVKRTALGRFKHEGAETILSDDGRLVVYSGDDQRDEYLYRFVSRNRVDRADRSANRNLLDHGTLSVARFLEDGTLVWEKLVHGQGPLTAENGFHSQADVLIDTRRAAQLLRATPMDRPEDVESNPVTGLTYVVLTHNRERTQPNPANPRARNSFGHILELIPPGPRGRRDHAADQFRWGVFLLAGNPADASHQARYGGPVSAAGWLACPDNIAFDRKGRMWIATDQGETQASLGIGDGLWACDTEGPGRGVTRSFFRCPTGAETTGPVFTPDSHSLFLSVQHPAGDDPGSSYDKPSTRWPDFAEQMPPRSSVLVIQRKDGGIIGG